MASFVQFRVWSPKKENEQPLVLTFTNMKQADKFSTWCIVNRRKYEMNGPYKLFTTSEQAVDELGIWDR